MPVTVRKKLISLQTKFLWGGNGTSGSKGIVPVKRSVLEGPIDWGGLGLGTMLGRNLSLLFKWWWRFSIEENTLWKKIVCSVHNLLDFKAKIDLFSQCRGGIWGHFGSIQKKWGAIAGRVKEGLINKLGEGTSLKFWEDT